MNDFDEQAEAAGSPGRQRTDPDPLAIAALILSALATAASVLQAHKAREQSKDRNEERLRARRLQVLKWENDLLQLERMIIQLTQFIESISYGENSHLLDGHLMGHDRAMYLDDAELKEYRILLRRLYMVARDLSTSTIQLIPHVDGAVYAEFLKPLHTHLSSAIRGLAEFRSLGAALNNTREILAILKKTTSVMRGGESGLQPGFE